MKPIRAPLDEQPMFFDNEPSTTSEFQRRLLHPAIEEDGDFRELLEDAPAPRRWKGGTRSAHKHRHGDL